LRIRAVHIGFLVFWGLGSLVAQSWRWKTYTSMNRIQDMAVQDSAIWCVTEGGLLVYDMRTRTFRSWTNTEGLASVEVLTVAADSKRRIYLGHRNGMIQRYDPETSSWMLLEDYLGHAISCLFPNGDTLFVGLDIGISMYLLSKKEVKETYRHLGRSFPVEIPVHRLLLFGKEIWAATGEGAVRARLDNPNLLDPGAWTGYTVANGLPQNPIRDFVVFQGELITATERGAAVYRNGRWIALDGGFPDAEVHGLTVHRGELAAATSAGAFTYSQNRWIRVSDEEVQCQSIVSYGGLLWIGTDHGLASASTEIPKWTFYKPDCPASNLFSDLAVDRNGVLWCASASTGGKGFYRFDGNRWSHFDTQSVPKTSWDDIYSVSVDPSNGKWFGTWGRGILFWNEQGPFRFYNSQNGRLAGIPEDPEFSVVSDVDVDSNGTVWLLNYGSAKNAPLVSVTKDSVWTYCGAANGLTTSRCRHLSIDPQGRKWIGTENQGVFVYDDRGTPTDKRDDQIVGTLTVSDGLASNQISALAVDRYGVPWIGTSVGLYSYENGAVKPKYGLPSDNVTALLVDGVNNLWVGTTAGLSLFSIRDYAWTHFRAGSSGLVSNEITSLALNYSNGKLFIGTNLGLSVLETPFSRPQSELVDLEIYPNPFLPSTHPRMTINNLAAEVSVRVFSPGGFVIRHFSDQQVFGRQIFWDGLDDQGQPVSGGIYVIVEQSKNGNRRIGKAAVVR